MTARETYGDDGNGGERSREYMIRDRRRQDHKEE